MGDVTKIALIIAAVWFVCAFIVYGFTTAYFRREFPMLASQSKWHGRSFAIKLAIFGPLGLISMIPNDGFRHGWML